MNDVIKTLNDIGLSEKEAKAYLALLSSGRSSVKKVAAASGLKRPTAYLILEDLMKKGFVLKIPYNKKTVYEASHPKEVRHLVQERFEKFNSIYPALESIRSAKETFNTFYFEGAKDVEAAHNFNIKEVAGTTSIFFGAKADDIPKEMWDIVDRDDVRRRKNNIYSKGVTVDHPSVRKSMESHPELYTNILLLPASMYNSDISIEAVGNFTRIVDLKEMKAVIIESKKLVETLSAIYGLIRSNPNLK